MVKDYIFTILGLYNLKQWSSKEEHLRVSSEALNPVVTQMQEPTAGWPELWPLAVYCPVHPTTDSQVLSCESYCLKVERYKQIAQSRASITSD